ncbi:Serine/threonine protein kinase [Marivirga sericea]|uniref:Serine/threonine protein kinase n=1 Tax=Marivirga sericea TaxID=1028 RepID=A0A1X7K3U5_9BACT|nr:serine/threonine-protein kinase [Marivirga sericea]SMG35567.1 Serine/threonine protein kinase [Marivirga sericea]
MTDLEKAEQLFDQAVKLPQEEREEYLNKTCGKDVDTKQIVMGMIKNFDEASRYFKSLKLSWSDDFDYTDSQLGSYKIQRLIGAGGMGKVYLGARNDGLYEQEVAVKILKVNSQYSAPIDNREQQILADLDHPGIAKIFNAGKTDSNQTYLVMELVEGIPIEKYVESEKLGFKEIGQLMLQIGKAVQHAHQNRVIHRDLKPSNILINKGGIPKLLDFGISVLDHHLEQENFQHIITPNYCAPEQIEGSKHINVTTDVYLLGVLFYKLITAKTPFELNSLNYEERKEKIKNTPPPSITTSINKNSLLIKDFDKIIARALSKKQKNRYQSVDAMMNEIEAALNVFPLRESKNNRTTLFQKFIKRNKVPVAISTIAIVLIGILSGIYISNLKQAQLTAEAKEQKAQETLAFLLDLFKQNDPTVNLGDSMSIGVLLGEGLKNAVQIKNPSTRAAVFATLGQVNISLGNYEKGESLLNDAISLYKELENDQAIGEVLFKKGLLKKRTADNTEALELFSRALELTDDRKEQIKLKIHQAEIFAIFNIDSAKILATSALNDMKEAELDRKEEILNLFNITEIGLGHLDKVQTDSVMNYKITLVDEFRSSYPEEKLILARFYSNLSLNYRWANKYDSALKYSDLNLDLLNTVYGKDNINTASGLLLMAETQGWSGNSDSAEYYALRSLNVKESLLGKNHPSQIDELGLIANSKIRDGSFEGGEEILSQAYELSRNTYGLYNQITGDRLFALLQHYNRMGKFEKSVTLYPDLIKVDSTTYGMTSNTATTYLDYAWALRSLDSTQKALKQSYRARSIYEKDIGKDHYLYGMALFNIGEYGMESMPEKALLYFDSAVNILKKKMPENHPRVGNYQHTYAEVLSDHHNDSLSNVHYVESINNYNINYAEDEPDRVATFQINYAKRLLDQNMKDSAQAVLMTASRLIEETEQNQIKNEIAVLLKSI